MRRLVAIATVLAAIGLGAAVVGKGAEADSGYRIDVIFDTARGLLPGQLVKIAGAETGEITDVKLTPDFKARVQMTVEQQFAPFRSDARCEIQPEALIAENFVQCTPGTPEGKPLRGRDGEAPTVPVENTAVPTNFTDLFNIWSVPIRDRLRLVLAGLGGGVAARGEELNELLERANPTLRQVRQVTSILDDQRDQLATAVEATDDVVAELTERRRGVQDLVEQGSRLTRRTARREGELRETVRRLPGLLDAARPALNRLDEVAASGRPVLRDLRAAAPQIQRAVRELAPFSTVALPAIERLGDVAVAGRRTAKSGRETLRLARRFAVGAKEPGALLNDLLVDLRDRGGVEGLMKFSYNFAAASARYDDISHILPAHLIESGCNRFSTTPVPGCSANFSQPPATTRTRARRPQRAPRRPAAKRPAPAAPAPEPAPAPQPKPGRDPLGVDRLLDKAVPLLPDLPLPELKPPLGKRDPNAQDPATDRSLLDFLLG